ncbi:MAG: serine/threonine-protein kinase [Bradymonadales bacterium]
MENLRSFQREAKVLSFLQVEGVAKFYEAIEDLNVKTPSCYIVQEYIEAASLQDYIDAGKRFSTREILNIGLELLRILQTLHSHLPPIVHRDIKSSNILLRPKEGADSGFDCYLIDFGAVSNPQIQHGDSTIAGTFGFMPPEQLTGAPVPASDTYALAATLFQLFSGIHPEKVEQESFILTIEPHLEHLPYEIVSLLSKMLHPNVKERLSNILALISIFSVLLSPNNIEAQKNFEEYALVERNMSLPIAHTLAEVYYINQPGASQLFKMLPEITPRTPTDVQQKWIEKRSRFTHGIAVTLALSVIFVIIAFFFRGGGFPYFSLGTAIVLGISAALAWVNYLHKQSKVSKLKSALIVDGVKAKGRISHIEFIHANIGRPYYHITYSFQIHTLTITGSIQCTEAPEISYKIGDYVDLLYHPIDPSINMIYPFPHSVLDNANPFQRLLTSQKTRELVNKMIKRLIR